MAGCLWPNCLRAYWSPPVSGCGVGKMLTEEQGEQEEQEQYSQHFMHYLSSPRMLVVLVLSLVVLPCPAQRVSQGGADWYLRSGCCS